MANLAPSLKSMVLPRLGQGSAVNGGVRAWLVCEPYSASPGPNPGSATLDNFDLGKLVNYISFDYQRFALSSLESFRLVALESTQYNLVSWPLLKLYYAAFFAAHSIMRATGDGIVKLEREQAVTISQILTVVSGNIININPGMYHYSLVETSPGRTGLLLRPHSGGTGVHDSFWRSFLAFLDDRSTKAVNEGMANASDFVAGTSEIAPAFKGWLSGKRNEINYQHAYGVWFPVVKSKSLNELIRKRSKKPSSSFVLSRKKDVESFLEINSFISCLSVEIGDYVGAQSRGGSDFGMYWRKFNNLYP